MQYPGNFTKKFFLQAFKTDDALRKIRLFKAKSIGIIRNIVEKAVDNALLSDK